MDAKQARRAHLRLLKQELGSVAALAELADADPNYISSIIGPKAKRNLGDDVARRIEQKRGMPEGAMDHPPGLAYSHANVEPVDVSESALLRAQLLADFERLPLASQEAIAAKAQQIREAIDGLPDYLRDSLSPPRDSVKYDVWEAKLLKEVKARPPIAIPKKTPRSEEKK